MISVSRWGHVSLLLVATLLLSTVAPILPTPVSVYAQSTDDPIDWAVSEEPRAKVNSTYGRFASASVKYNESTGEYEWRTEPMWVWSQDQSRYVPYILTDRYVSNGYYEVRAGLIGAKMYQGRIEYYDPSMQDLAVGRENWIVWERVSGEWRPIVASLQPYFDSVGVAGGSDHVNITGSWSTVKGVLTVKYQFRQNLKHTVTFTPNQAGTYAVTQVWNDTRYSDVKLGNTTVIKRTDDVIIGKTDALSFLFFNSTQPFGILEDQSSAQDKFQFAVFAGGTVSYQGISISNAVAWVFAPWALLAMQSLILDPDTSTLQPATFYKTIQTNQAVDPPFCPTGSYTWSSSQVGAIGGIHRVPYTGASDSCLRSVVGWDISTVPDSLTVTDVDFKYYTLNGATNGGSNVNITSIELQNIEDLDASDAWPDLANGTVFITTANMKTGGASRTDDLGSSADSDLQSKLGNGWDKFYIGFTPDFTSRPAEPRWADFDDTVSRGDRLRLVVTYTPNQHLFSLQSQDNGGNNIGNTVFLVTHPNSTQKTYTADSDGFFNITSSSTVQSGNYNITSKWYNLVVNESLTYMLASNVTLSLASNIYNTSIARYALNETALTSRSVSGNEISFTANTTGTKILTVEVVDTANYDSILWYTLNGTKYLETDSTVEDGLVTNITIAFGSVYNIVVALDPIGGGGGDGGGGGGGGVFVEKTPLEELGEALAEPPAITGLAGILIIGTVFSIVGYRLYFAPGWTRFKRKFRRSIRVPRVRLKGRFASVGRVRSGLAGKFGGQRRGSRSRKYKRRGDEGGRKRKFNRRLKG